MHTVYYTHKRGRDKGITREIILDDEGLELWNERKWCIHARPQFRHVQLYIGATNRVGKKVETVSFHRTLFERHRGLLGKLQVDHINGNSLDNRLENLRACTMSQNLRNQAATRGRDLPKGVYRSPGTPSFTSRITVSGRLLYLGSFSTPKEAHDAYCRAAEKYFKEFARAE